MDLTTDAEHVANLVNVNMWLQTCYTCITTFLVHGQVTIIFVVSVVCLSVCLFVQFFSAVFDPISIKLGHMLYVRV